MQNLQSLGQVFKTCDAKPIFADLGRLSPTFLRNFSNLARNFRNFEALLPEFLSFFNFLVHTKFTTFLIASPLFIIFNFSNFSFSLFDFPSPLSVFFFPFFSLFLYHNFSGDKSEHLQDCPRRQRRRGRAAAKAAALKNGLRGRSFLRAPAQKKA